MLKKIFLTIGKNIKNISYAVYDRLTIKHFKVAVADLILSKEGCIDSRQFLAVSRLLDIESYETDGNITFMYQNSISSSLKGQKYNPSIYNQNFEKLILSIKEKGYDANSRLKIDKDIYLVNGTHRVGMMLYLGIKEVYVDCYMRNNIVPNNINNYIASTLDDKIINRVINKYEEINSKLLNNGQCFYLWLSVHDSEELKMFMEIIKRYVVFHNVFVLDENKSFNYLGQTISGGYAISFIPNKTEYIVKNSTYYSNYVHNLYKAFNHRFRLQRRDISFLMTENCLQGYDFYCLIKNSILQEFCFS